MEGLTAQLARFVATSGGRALSARARDFIRAGFIDTVAVMFAGREEPVVGVVKQWVAQRQPPGASSRILFGEVFGEHRALARDAALVNATAGHALDYDDVGLQGHPSVVLVPALLAEADRVGASGEAAMRAYAAGYEVWAELISRDEDVHHLKGWHPTGVFGPLAVAAAIASLRGFDAARSGHALGLAASMASGLIANFGTMAKPFHAGLAAAHGIDAADLAGAGMTAAADVLERPQGYLAALSPAGRVDRSPMQQELAEAPRIETLGLTIKKYPMCFATHRCLDALLDLRAAHGLRPSEVREVQATISEAQAAMLRNHRPRTALEGKFSLEFGLAAALEAGRVGLAQLRDDYVVQRDVQALMPRVSIRTVDTMDPHEPTLAAAERVVVLTQDGRTLDSGEVSTTRGDPRTPLASHELEQKFMDCTARAGPEAGRLYAQLDAMEAMADLAALG